MNLWKRFASLRENLERYKATDLCPGAIAGTYSVLLAEAKKEIGNDPVVAALPEVEEEQGYVLLPGSEKYVDCGTMLTWVAQVQAASSEARGG